VALATAARCFLDLAIQLLLQLIQLTECPLQRLRLVAQHRIGRLLQLLAHLGNRLSRFGLHTLSLLLQSAPEQFRGVAQLVVNLLLLCRSISVI